MNAKLDLDPISKMSMPVTTLASPEIIKASREPSFFEKTFILKLGGAATATATASPQRLTHDCIILSKTAPDDKEIDVFDAKKYFNQDLTHSPKLYTNNLSSSHHLRKDTPAAMNEHQQPPIAALSVRSDSSWNSRSSLLCTFPKRQEQLRKARKKSLLASIGCSCSCFSTSIINGTSKQGDHKEKMQGMQGGEEAAKRRSNSGISLEKKLNMVTWDAIAPLSVAEELKIPSIPSDMHTKSDNNSETSSDLFEIESLYIDNPFDPTTCYAPSEASIEWSVVTASVADFSLLSDSGEVIPTIQTPRIRKSGVNSRTCTDKEMPKIRPSILSGCKNQKAVSVAGDAQTRRPLAPITRFHKESKLNCDEKTRKSSFDHRVMSQARSAAPTHLLYI